MTDRHIGTDIHADQQSAFDALYRAIVPSLLSFACQLASRPIAEDAVQDVMLDFWARRNEIQVRESVRGYLFGAVRRRIADIKRHAAVVEKSTARLASTGDITTGALPSPPASPSTDAESNELRSAVKEALEALPPPSRLIISLRWNDGLTYPEIAEALGISLAAAKKQGRRMEAVVQALLQRFAPE